MPFEIVHNDIVNMQVDAIVNTVNVEPGIGAGVDSAIHRAAGPELLEARKKIGPMKVSQAEITPAYGLDARYVIHTVSPAWNPEGHKAETALAYCYKNVLELALQYKCESIAFPLLASGTLGSPKSKALQTAVSTISYFLMEHEMQVYLVVFDKDAAGLSQRFFSSIHSYIDENYVEEHLLEEYGDEEAVRYERRLLQMASFEWDEIPAQGVLPPEEPDEVEDLFPEYIARGCDTSAELLRGQSLENLLREMDAGFSETLLKLIDQTGKKDSEVYKKANVDRKLFSKIRNNPAYKPSKPTAIAFALALELSLEDTKDFIGRAGYALTHSSRFDIIVEYFINQKNYDVFMINEALFAFDQPLIGA